MSAAAIPYMGSKRKLASQIKPKNENTTTKKTKKIISQTNYELF